MTREEQRINAAIEYANAVTGGIQDAWFDVILKTHQDATAWADEHPKEGLMDIEKALAFLRGIRLDYYVEHNDELVNDFRKAMEE